MDHLHVGPFYCETPIIASSFPLEVVNTFTSLIPALFGALAFVWLWRKGGQPYTLYVLAVLTFFTGIGSALWHAFRTPLTLAIDVFPGLAFFILFVFLWPMFLKNRWWGYGSIAVFFGIQFLLFTFVPFPDSNGPPIAVFVTATLFAVLLLGMTYHIARPAFWWGSGIIVCGVAAAFFRTIDLHTCTFVSFGTHFLWHIFLGAAAFCCIALLATIRDTRIAIAERR